MKHCVQIETNIDLLVSCSEIFIFGLRKLSSILINIKYLIDVYPSVLLHDMKTLVNFMRHLTSINFLYFA